MSRVNPFFFLSPEDGAQAKLSDARRAERRASTRRKAAVLIATAMADCDPHQRRELARGLLFEAVDAVAHAFDAVTAQAILGQLAARHGAEVPSARAIRQAQADELFGATSRGGRK